ncbi:aminotransferase class V-fold PLP-dependent enzyme [Alphaproteobacteria bacterium GH1-50]|uniref:Aminotransferase class V-fold PLP-dependent enzyme n=1 Tax=Kangsaoukella pontilimi TaxID=2691042 RepID=A0A7C9IF72_9RHOB|nr:aminotransferase class V-fold PLP-dependent enzyme [Kangsaoukella pontilimi]MXQ07147.1 aminotransferase class V-fold PLP-dependent enzyme [Kangsaoukella pontilimi]
MKTLDIDVIRAAFPAFSNPAFDGVALFDNAGGSVPCRQVIDRLSRFYHERKVQPYADYGPSAAAGEEMDEARSRLAAILGVDTDEVSFGPSTTQNTFVLANAFRQFLEPGDAIIVTDQDHEANSGPWRRLAEDGIEIREWKIDPETGHLDPADLPPLLDGARLLCFPHCSNVVGEINDAAAITAMAHEAGVAVCVDGVSYAPHGLPDVGAMGADIYLFSAYKTYGPHQGIMVIRRALGEALPNQGHFFNGDTLYKRFTPAGPDHAQVAASAGMADYIDMLADHLGQGGASPRDRGRAVHDAMRARETALLKPLLDYLGNRNSVRLLGPTDAPARAPTVAVVTDTPGATLAAEMVPHGIGAAGGDFYAVRPLSAMGIDTDHGVLRMSFTHYTTEAEVDRLIGALDHVL